MILTGLHTALGVRYAPYRMKERTDGVYDGSSAVLSTPFLKTLEAQVTHEYLQKKVNVTTTAEYAQLIAAESKRAVELVAWNDQEHLKCMVVGGDHSTATVSMLALQSHIPFSRVGYIQLDAHADLNTLASSPTGNYHGMHVRTLCDVVGDSQLDTLFQRKMACSHIMYIGNLDLDPEEYRFIKAKKIPILTISKDKPCTLDQMQHIAAFCGRFDHIHLSVDIDGLDATVAPATGIPCANGINMLDAESICHLVAASAHSLSADLVEVNPDKQGNNITCSTAQRLITAILRQSM